MTTDQVRLVKKSWSILQQIDPALMAGVFYSRLFTDKPSLRALFPTDMHQQYQKLVDMISLVIARLDRPDAMQGELAAMARRHTRYGVKEKHYALVGHALLWTLEKGLGKDWTAGMQAAWTACYQSLSEQMMRAARNEHPTGSQPA